MSAPGNGSGNGFLRRPRVSLRGKGMGVLAFPVAVLFVALGSVYWAGLETGKASRTVARSEETRDEILRLQSAFLSAQAARSAYAATGQPRFDSAYTAARGSILASLDRLRAGGDPRFQKLESMAAEELALLDRLPPDFESEASRMQDFDGEIAARAAEEERAAAEAAAARERTRQRLFQVVSACGILGPLGAILLHLLMAGSLIRRIEMVEENARRLAHGIPLERSPSGSDEISSLAKQIEDAADLLRARESEMRENERRYRELFDQAPVPYEETDRDGVIRRFNQAVCGLLRCTPDQIVGRQAWDFVSPDQQETFRAAMMERIASGIEAAPFQCDYMLEDGSRIAVEIRENLIRDAQGSVTGVCRSLLDVTDRNLAAIAARKVEQYAMELRNKNEQLARALSAARSATEAKSRFLASVSHELRTPLNAIIGFSELLHDGRLGTLGEEQVDVLSDILASARHLLRLINDILDLSKVEAGKMIFRPERASLDKLAREVRDVIRPLAEKKSIALAVEASESLQAEIDTARFKQVLYNYLSNAVKFTPPGGAVTLRLMQQDEAFFKLEVEDTGIGIPAAEISLLFQEFQQLPNSRKAEQGTGLGLALTRHIVEAQGGSVGVRSVPGRGSVFSAVLPIKSASPIAAEATDVNARSAVANYQP